MNTNTRKHAERELNILCKSATGDDRPIVEEFIPEILALCEKFGLSGQSGGSAPYVATILANTIKHLCLQEPICPIMGLEDEWVDVSEMNSGAPLFQNNRCSSIFKKGEGSTPYYLDAIVFKEENGRTFWGASGSVKNGNEVLGSWQYIKSFPFTPKTFYVDVISKEVAKDDWEFVVKDKRQLNRVFKYYTKPPKE